MRSLILVCLYAACACGQDSGKSAESPAGHTFPDGDAAQITLEVRFVAAAPETLAGLKGRSVIRSAPRTSTLTLAPVDQTELTASGGIRLISSSSVIEQQSPLFIERLDDDEVRQLLRTTEGDARSNILLAPKVTLFDGQTAQIQDAVSRPYVVGITSGEDGFTPQTETISEGTHLVVRAVMQSDDQVRLDLRARLSDVKETLVANAGPPNVQIQVPTVNAQEFQLSAIVSNGETLAILGIHTADLTITKTSPVQVGIPFGSRMFRNTSRAKVPQEILLLVTPRLLPAQPVE